MVLEQRAFSKRRTSRRARVPAPKIELVIDRNTTKTLGLTLPPTLFAASSADGVIRGQPRCLRNNAAKAELDQIEPINEHIHGANRIAIVAPIIEAAAEAGPEKGLLPLNHVTAPLLPPALVLAT